MLLDDIESGGVVYVNKATYDQALMLHSRFDGNIQRIIAAVKSKKVEIYITIPGLPQMIDKMSKTMPEPLNALAPFLMLCAVNQGIDWVNMEREVAYGILHQYSQMLDFNAMTLVPQEVRANVAFPTTLLMQYKVSWDDLCSTLEDKVVSCAVPVHTAQTTLTTKEVAPVAVKEVAQSPQSPKPVEKKEEEEDDLPEAAKRLLAITSAAKKTNDELNKKIAKSNAEAKPVKPVSQPTALQKTEAQESTAVLDEFDI